ncbi:MAG TPA: SCO family protein [Bacteroidia bacterium]|jgi:protein SCO1/2|nr:SCO family protein [Bacteroidia bacterium]
MKQSTNVILILAGILVLGAGVYLSFTKHPSRTLPYFGEKTVTAKGDTSYHTVSDFSLISQEGKTITQKNLEGKIYVADYFFANCKTICPKMSNQLERVQARFKNEPSFVIVSHTVDPSRDTVDALAAYARLHGADPQKWIFLTGDKKQLYELARHSYLAVATKGDGGPDDFVHTEQFALVDKEKHLRGFYDGTDSLEVNRLMTDIDQLLMSYGGK